MVEHRSTGLKFWPFMLLLALMAGCGTPSAPEAPAAEEADKAIPPPVNAPPIVRPTYAVETTQRATPAGDAESVYFGESYGAGLSFTIGDAEAVPPEKTGPRQGPLTTTLEDSQIDVLLGRLPDMGEDALSSDFAFREASLKPPLSGSDVMTKFPPDDALPPPSVDASSKELRVLRYAPDGAVAIAPKLSITFSAPMVPLSSVAVVDATKLPVKLTPKVDGEWRWTDPRTLQFKPPIRMPMATHYEAKIPKGTKSENGNVLEKEVVIAFDTPPPTLTNWAPSWQSVPLKPTLFVAFDQAIDPQAVLSTLSVTAAGSTYRTKLASESEKEEVTSYISSAEAAGIPGQTWVAFVLDRELPKDSDVQVELGPGTPSAEGAKVTTAKQSFNFRTYGPFKVDYAQCNNYECYPGQASGFGFNLTNPIDPETFKADKNTVSPKMAEQFIESYGQYLQIEGTTEPKTTYTVTLDAGMKDLYGQKLEGQRRYTFTTGELQVYPAMMPSGDQLLVLDPDGPRAFHVMTVAHKSLKIDVYKVAPEDYARYQTEFVSPYYSYYEDDRKTAKMPGKLVSSETVRLKGKNDEVMLTRIDISKALEKGFGHAVVVIEPTSQPDEYYRQATSAWLQSTQMGLTAVSDRSELVAWTSDLKTGATVSDAEVSTGSSDTATATPQKTGADGLAVVPIVGEVLVARKGLDSALLPRYSWGPWAREAEQLLWYVIDDRGMYRPNETVTIKGWIRSMDLQKYGDINVPRRELGKLAYSVMDPQYNELFTGELELNPNGGFNFDFKLPDNANLGYASVQFRVIDAPGDLYSASFGHSFRIEEFRRPEFEVTASAPPGPHIVGGEAVVELNAAYYSGGPLPDADTEWYATATGGFYTPPNRGDFSYGVAYPWWMYQSYYTPSATLNHVSRTDSKGTHRLKVVTTDVSPRRPMVVSLEGSVTDVNRQRWTAGTSLLIHPSEYYLGMRSNCSFVEAGQDFEVDTIVANLDGDLVEGAAVELRAVRLEWIRDEGSWRQQEVDPQTCTLSSVKNIAQCVFSTAVGGTYLVRGSVSDGQGRANPTEVAIWVAGGEGPPNRNASRDEVLLLPDKTEYLPGDTAEIMIQAPWYPAEGLVTVRRSGILSKERISLTSSSYKISIPIDDSQVPGLNVQVDLLGQSFRENKDGVVDESLPKKPAFARGRANLPIPPRTRTLTVQALPRSPIDKPGAKSMVDVVVRDYAGNAVANAEVALIVVDESVLALSGYVLENPIPAFYQSRSDDTTQGELRDFLLLEAPELLNLSPPSPVMAQKAMSVSADMGMAYPDDMVGIGGGKSSPKKKSSRANKDSKEESAEGEEMSGSDEGGAEEGIATRTNFSPLALFEPGAPTDKEGRASVSITLPDNLTRYRVMAVVASGDRDFGTGESAITARLDLMLRPSPPRFLNYGDSFELPVVVQNLTEQMMTVDVAVRGQNIDLTGARGLRVDVPAMDRAEVRFPAKAVLPGKARFQIAAVSGRNTDAADVQLPVWTPATTEAFAIYGELDDGAIVQPVLAPPDVTLGFGGLEITTSSTAVQALTDALIYLVEYPYDCSEQIASRLLGVVSLETVLSEFKVEGMPSSDELKAAIANDVKMLGQRQYYDGGFPYWSGEAVPYVSIHTAHALVRTRIKGYEVPDTLLNNADYYLQNIEQHIREYESRIGWTLSDSTRSALESYALYVRSLNGADVGEKAKATFEKYGLDVLSLEADGWLLATFARSQGHQDEMEKLSRHLHNRVEETPAAANFVSGYSDGAFVMLHSDRRSDAVILDALIEAEPSHELIPKVVRGLLGHQRKGKWRNTQENAFVLVALERYFSVFEAQTPDFVARVWLGDEYAGEQEYKGRTTERQHLNIPMAVVAEGKPEKNLILQKEGVGRLYYRLGLRYAPKDLKLEAFERGFTVSRTYEGADDLKDVSQDADGLWHVKLGASVKVKLTMVTTNRRYHVALVDKLPAGFEALNPALAVTGTMGYDEAMGNDDDGYWWTRYWYEHQNLRDERVEAFTSLLWEGEYTYSYIARATTPGIFVIPPLKAEEMYSPEVFGRSATEMMVIE